ncbi:MAG: CBS domain-containing protein [FCB group bacterium]|nr:CBS domain-containing protein [FCB group bacterium]
MVSELDDELMHMDDLEREKDSALQEGVTINAPISDLELKPPVIVSKGIPLRKAIKRLQEKSVGCVLVEDENRLVGILTERDILMKIAGKGLNFDRVTVDEYMTPNPETLHMSDTVAYALNKMYVGGFRNVPIVDKDNRPVGLVSVGDIVAHIAEYFTNQVINLPSHPQRKGFSRPEGG